MNCTIEEYIKNAKIQLDCNATEEYKKEYIVYTYSDEEVDNNIDYFQRCLNYGLSAYKALLFFGDYLDGEYDI